MAAQKRSDEEMLSQRKGTLKEKKTTFHHGRTFYVAETSMVAILDMEDNEAEEEVADFLSEPQTGVQRMHQHTNPYHNASGYPKQVTHHPPTEAVWHCIRAVSVRIVEKSSMAYAVGQ